MRFKICAATPQLNFPKVGGRLMGMWAVIALQYYDAFRMIMNYDSESHIFFNCNRLKIVRYYRTSLRLPCSHCFTCANSGSYSHHFESEMVIKQLCPRFQPSYVYMHEKEENGVTFYFLFPILKRVDDTAVDI